VNESERYDWLAFFLSFLFAAIPAWLIVGGVVWKYSPDIKGSTIFMISTIVSIIVGVVAGVWRNGFWSNAGKAASLSPYSSKPRK
jgi:hypothetical protein